MQEGQGQGGTPRQGQEQTQAVNIEQPPKVTTQSAGSVKQPAARRRNLLVVVLVVFFLVALIVGLVFLVQWVNSVKPERPETEDTETTLLTDSELEGLYVDNTTVAERVVATYDTKIDQASSDEEKAELHMARASLLAVFAATEAGKTFQEAVLSDAQAAEAYLHDVSTATLMLNLAELFGDQALYSEWYAIVLERNPDFVNGAG